MVTILFHWRTSHQTKQIVLPSQPQCPHLFLSRKPPPPLPPPYQLSSNISLGASPRRRNWRYHLPGCTAPIVALLHRRRCSSTLTWRALIVILLVIYIFSSFNNVYPSHMMLVDCCVLCCRGCGAAAIVHRSSIAFYLAFYLGHKLQVRQTQVPPPNQRPIRPKYLRQKYQGD
jgi:hypothetical protein